MTYDPDHTLDLPGGPNPYNQGAHAAHNGRPRTNPYPTRSVFHEMWDSGYHEGLLSRDMKANIGGKFLHDEEPGAEVAIPLVASSDPTYTYVSTDELPPTKWREPA